MSTKPAVQSQKQPTSLVEAIRYFSDIDVCTAYVAERRWPNGPVCPRCGCMEYSYLTTRRLWKCKGCKKQYSIKLGTIFEDSPLGLDKWLPAMWLVANSKNGISSHELGRALGVTQKSAWFMLQRIREACGKGGIYNGPLSGIVEADETYLGGKEGNRHADKRRHLHGKDKAAVLGMRERGGETRAVVLGLDTGDGRIGSEVRANVKRGSVLCTDEGSAYRPLVGYEHLTVNHSAKQYVDGMASTNSIESVWAVLKRGYYGIYHHFTVKHMQRYVDEFTYRLNEGNCKVHTMTRIDAMIGKTDGVRLTYKALIAE